MIKRTIFAAALLALPAAAHADDLTAESRPAAPAAARDGDGVPDQLDAEQRTGYRRVFAAIRAGQWADAQIQLDGMKPGLLHPLARAEIYTAKNSPQVDIESIMTLLTEAPDLPQAEQLVRIDEAPVVLVPGRQTPSERPLVVATIDVGQPRRNHAPVSTTRRLPSASSMTPKLWGRR